MWHVGVHIWEVPPDEIEPNYDEYYAVVMAFNLLNIPILPLVKSSIILLLLRAGSVIEWLKRVLYAILIFTVGSALIPWFLYIFICPPMTGNTWESTTFGGLRCMGRHKMGEMLIWVTCANLFTDLLILPIPFIIVRRMMSARLRSRLVVLAVFACSLAVTGIGGAKIYLSYRDRLFTLFKPDWTYPIDYCINHIENNVAIIVANIPILRGLVTRWVFDFRTKAAPSQRVREFRGDWQHNTSSSSELSGMPKKTRAPRVVRKILPCIQDDFSSSLATRSRGAEDGGGRRTEYPPRVVTTNDLHHKISYFPRSRRASLERYESTDSCEKGNMLETVCSVGSLGSEPTLVESRGGGGGGGEMRWTSMDLESPPLSATMRFSAQTLVPPTPLTPCRLRDVEDFDEHDEIYPYNPRL
ncbi:hypothetical protein NX059_008547 [Plenodomus lindquistii]|nr:hypothetical protein NX059_008547 [Plenodomus lindquistii]